LQHPTPEEPRFGAHGVQFISKRLIDKFASNSSEVVSIKALITGSMITFMPFLLAAGTALVFLLVTSPTSAGADIERRAALPINELEHWRP
jgi:hypothetical protein